jgi:oligopeptide transport system ATP-binding protein
MPTLVQPPPIVASEAPLLDVRDLYVHFPGRKSFFGKSGNAIKAVDGVSFSINRGETYGLVGESGCGKSTLSRAILGLVPMTSGSVTFGGREFSPYDSPMQRYRNMQMVFQDPFASLNPRMTVGTIISEPMENFGIYTLHERKLHVLRLMELVGLNPRFINRYPHEFSGGQRQRIGIARALAVEPKLLVLDEPVSALDVSIQAQVINLLMELQERLGLSYLFIAHDLSVIRHLSDRIGVMYLGKIVESAPTDELFNNPLHPYTRALLSAIPVPDPIAESKRTRQVLKGEIPSPDRVYPGCRFADRCPIAEAACNAAEPPLAGGVHKCACIKVATPA